MLVEFFTNKDNKKTPVHHKEQLTPRAKPYTKFRREERLNGDIVAVPVISITEGYYCYMTGPQSMKIAMAIGLNPGAHKKGMWLLSKSKYKQAQRLINSKGIQDKLIPKEKDRQRKLVHEEKLRAKLKKKENKENKYLDIQEN